MSARELLRLENLPVYQNKMFDSAAAARACQRGDVVLVQNDSSGLVSNVAFDESKLRYDESYQNEQAHSSAFQNHLSEVLVTIDRHFRSVPILEIGCGKGAFLNQLRLEGHNARGVDPAYEGNDPYIIKSAFEPGLGIRGDAIVMRHVLEHVPSPLKFLETVRQANEGQGKIYIEVPSFDWILRERAWFDVFYEHVNYFRLSDFDRMFANVRESGQLFGGQYIYVVAELASLRDRSLLGSNDHVFVPNDFFESMERCESASARSAQRIVWGSAAKGVMFSHHMLGRGLAIDFAIDINPAKQGKFLASSGLPVFSPLAGLSQLRPRADIFVMNSNYLSEIQAMAGQNFNYILVDRT